MNLELNKLYKIEIIFGMDTQFQILLITVYKKKS